jgi:hypothetical protein
MTKQTLKRNLRQLHQELAAGESMDPETRALLGEVADDIERILADESTDAGNIRNRIESAAWQFEASHPGLAGTLGEIADALAKLGI